MEDTQHVPHELVGKQDMNTHHTHRVFKLKGICSLNKLHSLMLLNTVFEIRLFLFLKSQSRIIKRYKDYLNLV